MELETKRGGKTDDNGEDKEGEKDLSVKRLLEASFGRRVRYSMRSVKNLRSARRDEDYWADVCLCEDSGKLCSGILIRFQTPAASLQDNFTAVQIC